MPLTTILMLMTDILTDMAPSITVAYEEGELDIMERMPRNAKLDRLVTNPLPASAFPENVTGTAIS